MVFGNILRNGHLSHFGQLGAYLQAIAIIEYAPKTRRLCGPRFDRRRQRQVRFDLTFQILAPEIGIITPTRDMTLTRAVRDRLPEKARLRGRFQEAGILDPARAVGNLDRRQGDVALRGSAARGRPTLVGDRTRAALRIAFERVNRRRRRQALRADKVEAIRAVEAIGAKYGIGRDMHIGDTIIGIKGRVGFEAAAPMLIIAAHKMLRHILSPSGSSTGRIGFRRGTACSSTRRSTSNP